MPLTLGLAAMATRFELVLDGERAAGEEALEEIAEVERRLSRFRRDALPARLERAAAGHEGGARGVVVSRDEMALLDLCRRACARTGGAFDPALGSAPVSGWRLDRRARRVVAPAAAARLDLGGVGKGHALDLAARALRAAGVARALLHGGTSSVAALGAPPGATAWRVALRHPADGTRTLATVELRDLSLSVSATHGRTRGPVGAGRGHVVDPCSGLPVETARLAAVVARHGRVAEAWSTALLVLVERRLRRGAPVTARSVRLAPNVSALVAWDDGAGLRVRVLGPKASLFTPAARAGALAESRR